MDYPILTSHISLQTWHEVLQTIEENPNLDLGNFFDIDPDLRTNSYDVPYLEYRKESKITGLLV